MLEHKFLPHCYVCLTRFSNQHPPGPAEEERHHILPEAYGGKNGPQVSLCTECHTKVHKLASAIKKKKSYEQFLINLSKENQNKLLWLGQKAADMQSYFENDPNKRFIISVALDKEYQLKFEYIKQRLNLSRKDTILKLIDIIFLNLRK